MATGNDLIALGYKPAKWFKTALAYINQHNLKGNMLHEYLTQFKEPEKLPLKVLHDVILHVNMDFSNDYEKDNYEKCLKSMQELLRTPTLVEGALMSDACPAGPQGTITVGGVAVANNAIHPGMHSADICCSLFLTDFGNVSPKELMDTAFSITHFGAGGRKDDRFHLNDDLKALFKTNRLLSDIKMLSLAESNLGTQGDGNHFLFIGKSKNTGNTVMVTHHGSRGVGALLYKRGMEIAENFRRKLSPETSKHNAWIPTDSEEGKEYWDALQIVRSWTKQNHFLLHSAIANGIGVKPLEQYWNEHNFVFKKGNLYYHAKGATPLDSSFMPDAGKYRIIPMNMAQPILIVEGDTTTTNLGFAPHGAGRNMGRGKFSSLQTETAEKIMETETKGLDIRFYSGKPDVSELPSAYKDANSVKRQIESYGLGRIVDEILPYGSIMAGHFDKFKHW